MGNFIRNLLIGVALFIVLVIVIGFVSSGQRGPSNLGPVGSTHEHVDFLVYMNDEPVDFSNPRYFVRSSFVHVESDNVGGAGKVIHVHATGVPLNMFFESVNMRLAEDCFRMDDGRMFCNDGTNELRFYVNGVRNEEYGDHILRDDDKILISYGDYSEQELQDQLARIPDFAKLQ